MNNKKTLPVILLVFVLLIGGAYVLYDRLGQEVETDSMIVHAAAEPEAEPEAKEADPQAKPEEEAQAASEGEGEILMAPDFEVYDREGNIVKLSSFFGKPIVLNFWASWCGPCQSEMPDFNEKYAELGDEVNFVMVNMTVGRETMETATAFIENNGYDFPVLFDIRSEAAMTYGAHSLPTSFFINAQGHVIAQAVGPIDAATLQKGIDMVSG